MRSILGILLFAVAAAIPGARLLAQEFQPGTVQELKRADLDGAPGMEVITSRGEYKPGQGIPRHVHHGLETGYVLQGALVQEPGREPRMLPTGMPIWNLRDVPHAGYMVVGDTPLILLTVHIVDKGRPVYDYVK
jgi:quercetin dioxygenase-like cupin family protein